MVSIDTNTGRVNRGKYHNVLLNSGLKKIWGLAAAGRPTSGTTLHYAHSNSLTAQAQYGPWHAV